MHVSPLDKNHHHIISSQPWADRTDRYGEEAAVRTGIGEGPTYAGLFFFLKHFAMINPVLHLPIYIYLFLSLMK